MKRVKRIGWVSLVVDVAPDRFARSPSERHLWRSASLGTRIPSCPRCSSSGGAARAWTECPKILPFSGAAPSEEGAK